jgi:hypothetical protein
MWLWRSLPLVDPTGRPGRGDTLVILFGGSTKQRQQHAIAAAKMRWSDYGRRKR